MVKCPHYKKGKVRCVEVAYRNNELNIDQVSGLLEITREEFRNDYQFDFYNFSCDNCDAVWHDEDDLMNDIIKEQS